MSRLPQLEAQLLAAAAGRRPRARRRLLVGAGVLAIAACVVIALLLAPVSEPQRRDRPVSQPVTVPAATLVKARALAQMSRPPRTNVADDRVAAEAKRLMAQTPYPPGVRDPLDWSDATLDIHNTFDVQSTIEYRAYCFWVKYWVNGADRAGATAVLEQTPYWPTMRRNDRPKYWQKKIWNAAREGDAAAMRQEVRVNCG
jgi:hypothetical protein